MRGCLRVRIDDRLLHSEVIFSELGTPHCCEAMSSSFDHLIIASTLAWLDAIETNTVPSGVRVTKTQPEEAMAHVREGDATLMVLGTLEDLERALVSSVEPTEIVLANRAGRPGTRQLGETFHVDRKDVGILRGLLDRQIPVSTQRVPSSLAQTVSADRLLGLELTFRNI